MFKILLIFVCTLHFSFSNELFCTFVQHRDGYNCEVKSSFKELITSINGNHLNNKTNDEVEVIFSPMRNNISQFPSGACLHFKNLFKFDIYGRNLELLSKTIFAECKKITQIVIMYTSIVELDEDMFADLGTLEKITINENRIVSLPKNLFKNNVELKYIDLSYNRIYKISTQFPASVGYIKLFNNPCVDKSFNGTSSFKEIFDLCPDENVIIAKNLTDTQNKIQELNSNLIRISANLDDLETALETSLNEVDVKIKNNTVQMDNINNRTVKLEKESYDKSIIIESIKEDFQKFQGKFEKVDEQILFENDKISNATINRIIKLEKNLTNIANENKVMKEEIISLESKSESNAYISAVFIILITIVFAIIAVMILAKYVRRDKREDMLLNNVDNYN